MIWRWSAPLRRSDAMARGAVVGSGHARMAAAVSTGCGPISSSSAAQLGQRRARSWRTPPAGARGGASRRRPASRCGPALPRCGCPPESVAGALNSNWLACASNSSRIGIQQRRMERVAGLQPVAADAVGRQSGDRPLQIRCRDRTTRCWRRCRRPPTGSGTRRRHASTRSAVGEHRDHPPARGQAAEQPAALGDQPDAVLEAEHARDARRRVLADAVAEHHVGFDAPRLPQPGQPHLHARIARAGRTASGAASRRRRRRRLENHVQQRLFEHVGDRVGAPASPCRRTPARCRTARGPCRRTGCPARGTATRSSAPRSIRRAPARCRAVVGERAEQLDRGFPASRPPARRGARGGCGRRRRSSTRRPAWPRDGRSASRGTGRRAAPARPGVRADSGST